MTDNETDKQIDNSKPWLFKPGESGNPAGRPPNKKYISEHLREMLEEVVDGKTNSELIAGVLVKLSKNPQDRAFAAILKEVLDRTEGKVPDKHEIEAVGNITLIYKQMGGRDATEQS